MLYIILFLLSLITFGINCRSPHRLAHVTTPELIVNFVDSNKKFHTYNPYIDERMFHVFDQHAFEENLLPHSVIFYSKNGAIYHNQIELDLNLLTKEVISGQKKDFSNFQVLHKRNFNFKKKCGLLIFKHNVFPFVVKFFVENPESFIEPGCKGIEPNFFFFMSGGIGRHLAGFTRVANRNTVELAVKNHEYWKDRVSFPRKWYWFPVDQPWLEVVGKNMHSGNSKHCSMKIPSVYAIIADYCKAEEDICYSNIRNEFVMKFCNDISLAIDPHESNFIVTNKKDMELHLTVIDTEHFPTMVGLDQKVIFQNHNEWFGYLAFKCLKDAYFKIKVIV